MNRSAPRSIDQYLRALREELAGEDAALIQDALYDAEEYLRAEVAAHPDKSESDVLELIASTYGAPDEVASAYRDTEALGIAYFVIAVVGLSVSLAFIFAPLVEFAGRNGWFGLPDDLHSSPAWLDSLWALPLLVLAGVLLLTLVMHLARGVGRLHAMYAKALLVAPTASPLG
jgi:hypothetical protein